jgi:hypothetical protein
MKGQETVNKYHYPTPEELYAIELAAQRARSREMKRVVVQAARALKGLFVRAAAALSARKVHHA